jgi:hypothetical protein
LLDQESRRLADARIQIEQLTAAKKNGRMPCQYLLTNKKELKGLKETLEGIYSQIETREMQYNAEVIYRTLILYLVTRRKDKAAQIRVEPIARTTARVYQTDSNEI